MFFWKILENIFTYWIELMKMSVSVWYQRSSCVVSISSLSFYKQKFSLVSVSLNFIIVHITLLSCFSRVWLFATLRTVGCQAPLVHGKNTGVGCHFLLQGIFPTQWSNPSLPSLLRCRQILYHWAGREAPYDLSAIFILFSKYSIACHSCLFC